MCVTSPPFYGLRDYGIDGQIGLEETPEQWVDSLVAVFREVRRVLQAGGDVVAGGRRQLRRFNRRLGGRGRQQQTR